MYLIFFQLNAAEEADEGDIYSNYIIFRLDNKFECLE
jgi:hypothetical protein